MERMVADFQPTLRAETKKLEDIKLQFAEVSEQNQTLKSRCEHVIYIH